MALDMGSVLYAVAEEREAFRKEIEGAQLCAQL